jgi:hypothetical protein
VMNFVNEKVGGNEKQSWLEQDRERVTREERVYMIRRRGIEREENTYK